MTLIGILLMVAGTCLMIAACRTNRWNQQKLVVSEGQVVISRGPYRFVRHPHYLGALLYFGGIPCVIWFPLFSLWIAMVCFYVFRIFDEEVMLKHALPGYPEYMKSVKYRLIPGLF